MTREQMINNNWNKICEYIEKEYKGFFESGYEYSYGRWGEEFTLGITADGKTYARGYEHGYGSVTWRSTTIDHSGGNVKWEMDVKERLIKDWYSIKTKINDERFYYTDFFA